MPYHDFTMDLFQHDFGWWRRSGLLLPLPPTYALPWFLQWIDFNMSLADDKIWIASPPTPPTYALPWFYYGLISAWVWLMTRSGLLLPPPPHPTGPMPYLDFTMDWFHNEFGWWHDLDCSPFPPSDLGLTLILLWIDFSMSLADDKIWIAPLPRPMPYLDFTMDRFQHEFGWWQDLDCSPSPRPMPYLDFTMYWFQHEFGWWQDLDGFSCIGLTAATCDINWNNQDKKYITSRSIAKEAGPFPKRAAEEVGKAEFNLATPTFATLHTAYGNS